LAILAAAVFEMSYGTTVKGTDRHATVNRIPAALFSVQLYTKAAVVNGFVQF